jgi:autophagy-related protein 2
MIMDGSLKAMAPRHHGAVVLHMGDLKFSINLIGDSPDLAFALGVPAAAILAIDNISDMTAPEDRTSDRGPLYWKVCHVFNFVERMLTYYQRSGFALLAEISDLTLRYSTSKNTSLPDMRVSFLIKVS